MKEFNGRFLYHSGYYDGPLNGVMITAEGNRYWFEVSEQSAEDWSYWYLLYELTAEEWEYEDHRHALFQQHVGTHCDYDLKGKRDHGAVKPMEEWDKFYDDEKYGGYLTEQTISYTDRDPVGSWDPHGTRGSNAL